MLRLSSIENVLGTNDGCFVGTTVGIIVGDFVGCRLGVKLGCKLGVKEGIFDGNTVFVVGWEVGIIMFEKYTSLRKPELESSPAKHQILRL